MREATQEQLAAMSADPTRKALDTALMKLWKRADRRRTPESSQAYARCMEAMRWLELDVINEHIASREKKASDG